MKQIRSLFFIASVLLLSAGCRKNVINNLSNGENIVYITEHDSTANFNSYQTFRIADSVSIIQNGRLQSRERGAYDSSLINAITDAMTQRGYVKQTNMDVKPDIGVNVSILTTSYTGIVSYDDYWGYYDSYWDPYYWGYGGYGYYFPYSFGIYTYEEGAISIDMIDLKNPDTQNNRLHTLWTGLVRGTGIFNNSAINTMVKSLFSQSPYLQH